METRLVGIDASTKKTGMCLFKDGNYSEHILLDYSKCSDSNKRIDIMINAIREKLEEWNPDIIYIEDDWNAANIQTTKMLSEIIGSVRGYSLSKDIFFGKFLPSQWRSLVGIETGKKKRQELKQEAINYIGNKYNITVNDDVAECICIAEASVAFYDSVINK